MTVLPSAAELPGVPVGRRAVLLAGLTAGAGAVAAAALPSVAGAAGSAFQHGVASGDPLPGGILLWTRVTPTPESVPASGLGPQVDVDWQVATDAGFATVVRSGTVSTGPDRDHTVKADISGLSPATTYWYRFGLGGEWSPVGRTMTAPAATDAIARLRAGVVSCANWEAGYFAAYRHLAERGDLNLVVHLGDYIYEYGTGQFDAGGTVVRTVAPLNETLTLADYRTRHALYKTDPDLKALHASVPWIITWDDHEVANDMWSGGAENHTPATEGDFAARVAAARQAYAEWMPVRLAADGHIYRRLRYGDLFELSMLDLRTYRSQQASGAVVDDEDRTIAGAAQLNWLTDGLVNSTALWKIVGNPVMISRLDVLALPAWLLGPLGELIGVPQNGVVLNADQWDGYNADRERLVDTLRAHDTRDVVFITGDIHTSWANELTTKDTGTAHPAAAEFVVPSVTSDNINDALGTSPGGPLSLLAASLIRATNPHVKWVETDGHGFGVLDITRSRCRMDWYHLADRTRKDSAAKWVQGWSVGRGSAKIRKESAPG
ncbi:alkaline phosphatase [Actinoplanes sp. SE50]|uniref:alkaline phosphatase D family protein n=1 Tax=unclassified Actinoplanes TaxID=2626549 RepID=UPI00023ED12F|nr:MULTISPECIES: alkaline phosphatase D family protein [unclassified Actinoplanes]AEV87274.1 alkaline phosphatase [Actinoplanes sp. SE50/110]ATO85674.1 alkaline phosphatase [Actinoplanes sp. SE50]SLM03087.1 secreted alkaline phosphatase [Actinoplanes sp. SE50/110]